MTDWQPIRVRDVNELLDAMRVRQRHLQRTAAQVEHDACMCPGHLDKIIGPSRSKSPNALTLDKLMVEGLAFDLVMVGNAEKEAALTSGLPARKSWDNHRVSKKAMERVKPLVLRESAANASAARMVVLSPEHRTKIARYAAKIRWRLARAKKRNPIANGELTERTSPEVRTKIARKAGRASARAKRLRKRIFEAAAQTKGGL